MWVIPNNHSLSSRFALAMVESSEDLSSLASDIESSLMWRSKPSPLQTWLRRWKRVSWMQPLCGRILKRSQHTAFETEFQSLHLAIHVSHFQPQESEQEKTTPGTYGRTSTTTYKQLDLFAAFLRTSKDTSASDSERSLKTWKALVTQRRGEYSARLKSARHTNGSESLFWPTPAANKTAPSGELTNSDGTPWRGTQKPHSKKTGKPVQTALEDAVRVWMTPTASDFKRRGPNSKQQGLSEQVNWPTPRASEYKDCGPVGSRSHTHMDNRSYLCAKVKEADQPRGLLNPDWVEWLMGVPTGWTGLGSWGME